MVHVTKWMVLETGASTGYTQSDEISLVWQADDLKEQIFFNGRLLKMVSVLAAMTTAEFNRILADYLPVKKHTLPVFDCRVWNVPTEYEASNYFIWREQDATRNSVSMAAQAHYSHNELHGKSSNEMQEMLFQKGVNWNDYPRRFKRGTYVRRREVEKPFTAEELDALPPKHEARTNPDLVVKRRVVLEEDFSPLTTFTNRDDVILRGADPVSFHAPLN